MLKIYCIFNFLILIFHTIQCLTVETLHFESACLYQSNNIHLNLQCSNFEHIQIIRIIYGYTKQMININKCQFSIYDCIQEGASRSILDCNGKQTCSIYLTKTEMFSTTVTTHGVPSCSDFNYVQVNFGCVPNAKDVCDSWKEEAPIIHLSHTRSRDQQYRRCHCKIRSSISNGQVLLHAREINREFASLKQQSIHHSSKISSNIDCKKTTYLEIATDRSERKCMDMLPSTGSALFGSGTHNFSLTYVRNDDSAGLFFFFELKASPMKKDHNVQIICNWARRTTTTTTTTTPIPIDLTTSPIPRRRKPTTMGMQRGGKLSRLDLIRHRQPSTSEDNLPDIEVPEGEIEERGGGEDIEPSTEIDETLIMTTTNEIEEDLLTTSSVKQLSKRKKKTKKMNNKLTTTTSEGSTSISTTTTSSVSDDEEWSRILSMAAVDLPPSKQLLSLNNRTFLTATQASLLNNEKNSSSSSSTSNNVLLIILLVGICITLFALIIYCLRVKRPDCLRHLMMNSNVALLFCCEAGKLLFCSSTTSNVRQQSRSITSTTPASTFTQRHRRHRPSSPPPPMVDYQSSEYYMDGIDHGRTTQSIYDRAGGKSIYSIEDDDDGHEETEYTTKYDRHNAGDSC